MRNLYVFLLVFLFISCNKESNKEDRIVVLQGEVINRPNSKHLALVTQGGDYRTSSIKIPIENNRFSYQLKADEVQQYNLAFQDELDNGSWMEIDFFSDADTIFFTLHNSDLHHKNIIKGGESNSRMATFGAASNTFFKVFNTIESSDLSQAEKKAKIDSLTNVYIEFEKKTIREDQTIFGYALLLDKIFMHEYMPNSDLNFLESTALEYQKKFPEHTYSRQSSDLIKGIKTIQIGGKYVDFTAPNAEGKMISVSSVVNDNKFTLIDLWAPWCGPCIAKDKKLLPHYNDLKEKGFEVIGLLSGIDSISKYHKTLKKYNYPWTILSEVNAEYNIYEKYNISNSGGAQFLVNNKGVIVAINPSVQQIDSILNTTTP